MRAYVLVDCSPRDVDPIIKELDHQSGIILADKVNGPHPVVCVVEGEEPGGLADTILFRIRKLPGVTDITAYLTEPEGSEGSVATAHQRGNREYDQRNI